MTGFLVKKSFFDGWDNLIKMALANLGFLAFLALAVFLPLAGEAVMGDWSLVLAVPGILCAFVYAGVIASVMKEASDYQSPGFRDLPAFLARTWKASLIFGLINCAVLFLFTVAFPFYLSAGGIIGAGGAGVVFWMGFFWLLAGQYFFPLLIRMGDPLPKVLKKCFIMILDNPGYSLFLLFWSALLLVLSVATALLLPGLSGLLLWHQDAFKLRLYKYDWLEENPGRKPREIPWDELLGRDRDAVGPRSLKGMIFPWKD